MSNVPPPNPFGVNYQSTGAPQAVNPYEASVVQPSVVPASDPESIRKYYLSHEASIKSIGTLYLLGALLLGMCSLVYICMFIYGVGSTDIEARQMAIPAGFLTILCGTMTVVQAVCVYGLWTLKGWARIFGTVLACFGLLMFPLGTIINAYFIYLLQSEKANVIFSDAYKDIIRQTPHVKYRTSIITWTILGLLVLFVIGIIVISVGVG